MYLWWKEFFYLGNLISFFRILCVYPCVIFFQHGEYLKTLWVVFLIILSDFLDGYVARKLGQVSSIGKGIDPLADKICMIFVLFLILRDVNVSLIPFIFMLFRDCFLIFLGIIAINRRQPITGSDMFGKMMTFLMANAAVFFLLDILYLQPVFLLLGKVFYYLSFFFLIITFYTYGKVSYLLLKISAHNVLTQKSQKRASQKF